MSITADICRKATALSAEQIAGLEAIEGMIELAADIACAQITVYASAAADHFLVIVTQAKPHTSFIDYKANLLGSTIHSSEEPLVWRTITTGESITGQREWAWGRETLVMHTFPLHDSHGNIIAAVSLEASIDDSGAGSSSSLVETAKMLLASAESVGGTQRPLAPRDGIMIIDSHGQILYANAAAVSIYKMLGVGRIVGRRIYDRNLNARIAQRALHTHQSQEHELELGGTTLLQRAIPIVQKGQTTRIILLIADVTDIKKKEKELLVKSAVIQEIHHRVKNNLQTVASLLRLQARRSTFPEVKAALRESVNRILSISVVHEFLSQQDKESIDVAEVAKNILDLIIQNMLEPDFNIQTVFTGPTVILPSEQATSLALAINELIQNSLEHGFVGLNEGVIGVDIASGKDAYQIEIYDNGVGLPTDFTPQATRSLGLQIVKTLVENDLGGQFTLYSNAGTRARIIIPRISGGG
ncbi:histidine kinase [Anaerosporomusa subterranea]|uniref:histidine kinase n=1 Tax=Anaerosporomusa subterranea TaxID=1794912 RepID=A0A154BMS4_ANASB|nr:histidine kinase N-terminal domain-containing protein [Anaerosporomusa subterranea]KYZ75226.1 histidine kinase [Anaerosporomusa subterranea]